MRRRGPERGMGSSLSVVHPEHGFVRGMKCSLSVNPECGLGDGRGEADNGASAMRKKRFERGSWRGMSDGRGGSQMQAR